MTLRIGWFSTGRDEDAIDILARVHRAISEGSLDARIEFVFCNRERGEAEVSDPLSARPAEGRPRAVAPPLRRGGSPPHRSL